MWRIVLTLIPICMLLGACTTERVVTASAVAAYHHYKPRPGEVPVEPVYCYSTLASVDCYDHPLENQQYRFQGADGVIHYPEQKETFLDTFYRYF